MILTLRCGDSRSGLFSREEIHFDVDFYTSLDPPGPISLQGQVKKKRKLSPDLPETHFYNYFRPNQVILILSVHTYLELNFPNLSNSTWTDRFSWQIEKYMSPDLLETNY